MSECRICNNAEDNTEFQILEMMYGSRDKFDYFQCSHCGCLQIKDIPSDMGKYYPSGYYSFAGNRCVPHLARKMVTSLRDHYAVFNDGLVGRLLYQFRPNDCLRALARLSLRSDQQILDVGCGGGLLLQSLQCIGFKNLLGVDPFVDKDIDYGDGLRVQKKELTELQGKWDLVMFFHSFEHIKNQLETLQTVRSILDDKGTCLVSIPIVPSFAWRHYGVNWVQLDAPRHLFLHSVESMALLSSQAGLYVEHVSYDSNELQFWGSELFVRGIPLMDQVTKKPVSKKSFFSNAELKKFLTEADRLNASKEGDQAVFYLKKESRWL